jgi:hypothetical protein
VRGHLSPSYPTKARSRKTCLVQKIAAQFQPAFFPAFGCNDKRGRPQYKADSTPNHQKQTMKRGAIATLASLAVLATVGPIGGASAAAVVGQQQQQPSSKFSGRFLTSLEEADNSDALAVIESNNNVEEENYNANNALMEEEGDDRRRRLSWWSVVLMLCKFRFEIFIANRWFPLVTPLKNETLTLHFYMFFVTFAQCVIPRRITALFLIPTPIPTILEAAAATAEEAVALVAAAAMDIPIMVTDMVTAVAAAGMKTDMALKKLQLHPAHCPLPRLFRQQ